MYVNRRGEHIYFNGRGKENLFLNISLAGITFPNPEYLIVHNSSKYDLYNYYIFEYVVSGKGYLDINKKKHELNGGSVYFINKFKFHSYYSDKKDPFKKMFIVLSGSFIDGLLSAFQITDDFIIKKVDLSNLFQQFFDEIDEIQTPNESIQQLIFKLIQSISSMKIVPLENKNIDLSTMIQNYLDSNLRKKITLADISESLHISKSHIERAFTESYGNSPLRYFAMKKVQYACELLINTNYSITEISKFLSYSSPKHFSYCVRKYVGMSPMQYKKHRLVNIKEENPK